MKKRKSHERAMRYADSIRGTAERYTCPHTNIRDAWLAGYRAALRDARKGKM